MSRTDRVNGDAHERPVNNLTRFHRTCEVIAFEIRHTAEEGHIARRCVLGLQPADVLDDRRQWRARWLEQMLPCEDCPIQPAGAERLKRFAHLSGVSLKAGPRPSRSPESRISKSARL